MDEDEDEEAIIRILLEYLDLEFKSSFAKCHGDQFS